MSQVLEYNLMHYNENAVKHDTITLCHLHTLCNVMFHSLIEFDSANSNLLKLLLKQSRRNFLILGSLSSKNTSLSKHGISNSERRLFIPILYGLKHI